VSLLRHYAGVIEAFRSSFW